VTYRIEGSGCGPKTVNLNGGDLPFTRDGNPFRMAQPDPHGAVRQRLTAETNPTHGAT